VSAPRITDPDLLLPHVGRRNDGSRWTLLLVSLGFVRQGLFRSDLGPVYGVGQQYGMRLRLAWLGDLLGRRDRAAWGLAQVELDHSGDGSEPAWPGPSWRQLDPQHCSLADATAALGVPAAVVGDEASFFAEQVDGRTLVFALRWTGDARTGLVLRSSMVTHLGGFTPER
jgi:hypothetical protein